jgi:hypothetical protein
MVVCICHPSYVGIVNMRIMVQTTLRKSNAKQASGEAQVLPKIKA